MSNPNPWQNFWQQLAGQNDAYTQDDSVGGSNTVVLYESTQDNWNWTESLTITVNVCLFPSTTLYPATNIYPC